MVEQVLPAIEFVWNRTSSYISAIAIMIIVRARLVEQRQVLSYYDPVLYNNSRLL